MSLPVGERRGRHNYQFEDLVGSTALRHVQPPVKAHCAAVGVPYIQTGLFDSYGYLNTVGLKGRDQFLCPLLPASRL